METTPSPSNSSTGLQTDIASLLTYVLGWVTGLIFLLIEKKDDTVRWHAAQSFAFSVAIFVLSVVVSTVSMFPWIGWIIGLVVLPILWLGVLAIWIVLMIKGYQGQKWELPFVGKFIPALLKIGA